MTSVQRWTSFIQQYLQHPQHVGAVAPSSKFLAREMVEWIDWPSVRSVVEYGPGTGSFTGHILESARPDCRYLGIEFNPVLAKVFRSRFPNLTVVEDSVSNVRRICRQQGFDGVDCIVSGLPWASLPLATQLEYLEATRSVLGKDGQFVTFAYLQGLILPAAQRFRKLLKQSFSEVSTSRTVWLNVPPAFIYRCRR